MMSIIVVGRSRYRNVFISPLDEASIAGYTLITDIYGQPAYVMQVIQPRTIHKAGEVVTSYLVIFQVASGVIFAVIILIINLVQGRRGL